MILAISGLILVVNLYVGYLIAKSDYYEPLQKYLQYGLIWLLPLAGALLCYAILKNITGKPGGRYPESIEQDVHLLDSSHFDAHHYD